MKEGGDTHPAVELLEDRHEETLAKTGQLRDVLVHLHYEGKASLGRNVRQAKEVLGFLGRQVSRHMDEEGRALFPYLESHIPRIVSFKFWLDELEKENDSRARSRLITKLGESGAYLTHLLEGRLREESEILYRVADRGLRQDEKKELVRKIEGGVCHGV